MSIPQHSIPILPFADLANVLLRQSRGEYLLCPTCGKIVPFIHQTATEPHYIEIRCPDCQPTAISITGIDEGGNLKYKLKDTEEEYNPEKHINEIKVSIEQLPETSHSEKASLLSKLAEEQHLLGVYGVQDIWPNAVDEYKAAFESGDDPADPLIDSLMFMIKVRYPEVTHACIVAAKLLVERSKLPATPRECLIWLWLSQRILKDSRDERDYALDVRERGRKALSKFSAKKLKDTPFLKSLDLIWEYSRLGATSGPVGDNQDARDLYVRFTEEFFSVLKVGTIPDPAVLDLYLEQSAVAISRSEDRDAAMELFASSADLFGEYSELIRARYLYYRTALRLMDKISLGGFLGFEPLAHKAQEIDVEEMQESLKAAENYSSLTVSGRTLVDGYMIYSMIMDDPELAEGGAIYFDMMRNKGVNTSNLSTAVSSITRAFTLSDDHARIRRMAFKKSRSQGVSKKDRVKQRREEHINKKR